MAVRSFVLAFPGHIQSLLNYNKPVLLGSLLLIKCDRLREFGWRKGSVVLRKDSLERGCQSMSRSFISFYKYFHFILGRIVRNKLQHRHSIYLL